MELILWRHAEAAPGAPDSARPLTENGRRQAARMARFLGPRLPDDLRLIVSPARRAQETARALGRSFETVERIAPGCSVAELLEAAGWPDGDRPVLAVGHQPTFGEAAALLVEGRGAGWELGTGAACWLESRARANGRAATLLLSIEQRLLERDDPAG